MFLHLAFRPFFLIGSLVSAFIMALWLGFLLGFVPNFGVMPSIYWHGHEMVFGFSMAVIAGFVLTAIQNWTGIRSAHGKKLGNLVALWLLGRVAMLAPEASWAVAIIDLSFYPVFYLVYSSQ